MRSTPFHIPHADPFWNIPLFGFGWLVFVPAHGGRHRHRVYWHGWSSTALADLPLCWWLPPSLLGLRRCWNIRAWRGLRWEFRFARMASWCCWVSPQALACRCTRHGGWGSIRIRSSRVLLDHPGRLCRWADVLCDPILGTIRHALPARNRGKIINLTDGGLVVYGSFIGAALAVVLFVLKHRLPLLALADLLTPGFDDRARLRTHRLPDEWLLLGWTCDDSPLGITFPPEPPYIDQLENGALLDLRLQADPASGNNVIQAVIPGGLADRHGLKAGEVSSAWCCRMTSSPIVCAMASRSRTLKCRSIRDDGRMATWRLAELPARTQPTYPVQILSAINAALICLFLWTYYPLRRSDGEVFALLITIYPVIRILEEMIRTDESSVLSANFRWTFSHSSAACCSFVLALWCFLLSRPRRQCFAAGRG